MFLDVTSNGEKRGQPSGSPRLWFVTCGCRPSCISMAWELVRNADSQALPEIRIRNSGVGPSYLTCKWFWHTVKFGKHCAEEWWAHLQILTSMTLVLWVLISVRKSILLEIYSINRNSFKVVRQDWLSQSLHKINILRQRVLCCGGYPVHYRCLAASLASIHKMPVVTTTNVSRCCHMSPGMEGRGNQPTWESMN